MPTLFPYPTPFRCHTRCPRPAPPPRPPPCPNPSASVSRPGSLPLPREKLHLHLAHLNHVARTQFRLHHRVAVYLRAVGGIQVPQNKAVLFAHNRRLRPRHLGIVRNPVIVVRPAPERG